jgi:hypothetical protein
MLNGITRLVVTYGDGIKDDIFKEKVGKCSVKEIIRTAKERRAGSIGYAEAMLLAYNKKMHAALKWSKLYSTKGLPNAAMDELEEQKGFEDSNADSEE